MLHFGVAGSKIKEKHEKEGIPMKRFVLAILLLVLLITGCVEKESAVVATVSPAPVSVTVNSVDDFLKAIGPNTHILLEAGYYDLTTASDYGMETDSPYYKWVDITDGYQLNLQDVDQLTIRGSGRESTELVHTARYANVLCLENCSDVLLENFTAGHTDGGDCAGGVIDLWNCRQAKLLDLGLYGCGTTGIRADSCADVAVRNSEIYDCSSNAVQADSTDGLWVENCTIHDLGVEQFAAGQVFWLRQCSDVNIRQCSISDNRVLQIFNCQPAAGIELRNCAFTRNRVQSSVFSIVGGGLVMENCTFVDNAIRNWFDSENGTILDGIGKTWDEDMLDVWYNLPVETMPAGDRTEVVVSTVDELIAAIGPDTEIILKDGIYDLSTATDYGTGWSDYHYWSEEFDGPALVISGVDNLVIRSESGDVTKCTVSAVPRYADVLKFKSCTNITVSGFTAGHTVEPGYCTGGVLYFEDCDNVLVNRCGLYGCGILGVRAELCSAIAVTACEIYECSYGGIQMGNVSGIKIEGCSFRDLGGDALSFYECRDVVVDGETVSGNARMSY